jgi:WD40 repeat protein
LGQWDKIFIVVFEMELDGWSCEAPISALACSPDGTQLAIAENTGWITVYDMQHHRQTARFSHGYTAMAMHWHPHRHELLTMSRGQLLLWDMKTYRAMHTHDRVVPMDMAWLLNGKLIVYAAYQRTFVVCACSTHRVHMVVGQDAQEGTG